MKPIIIGTRILVAHSTSTTATMHFEQSESEIDETKTLVSITILLCPPVPNKQFQFLKYGTAGSRLDWQMSPVSKKLATRIRNYCRIVLIICLVELLCSLHFSTL